MTTSLSLDPGRAALLVMDFQNDIGSPGGKLAPDDPAALERFAQATEAAARAMEAARRVGMKVIHVAHGGTEERLNARPHMPLAAHIGKSDALREGDWGFDFMEKVAPKADEAVYAKSTISSLASTELNRDLRDWGIDTLVLTGLVTHFVIEGTARDAADRGFRVILLSDAMNSGGIERHESSLALLGMLTTVADSAAFVAALEP